MKRFISIMAILLIALATCACGGSKEEAPQFEQYNIESIDAETGISVPYESICYADDSLKTVGTAIVSDYSRSAELEGRDSKEGYEWLNFVIELNFSDENANLKGFMYNYLMSDYYSASGLKDSLCYDYEKLRDEFELKWNDKKYKCCAYCNVSEGDWEMTENEGLQKKSVKLSWQIQLPEGYDGLVLGLYNAAKASEIEGANYFYECYDSGDFVLFRLK